MKRLLSLSVMAALANTLVADGYEDPVIRTDDASVRAVVLPTRFAYVFTNTTSSITVSLKDEEKLSRTLVVAGGGAGGMAVAGGGGGGGVIRSSDSRIVTGGVVLSVGQGGVAADTTATLTKGGDSMLTVNGVTETAKGGGIGLGWGQTVGAAQNGGSGGGGTMKRNGGTGTSGQGYSGGSTSSLYGSGGGGGASEAGHPYDAALGGVGGEGVTDDITGEPCVYGSGGGGGGGSNTTGTFVSGKGGTNAADGGENAPDGFGGGWRGD